MKKRLLACLLTLVMLLALLPATALAADEGTQANPWDISAEGEGNNVTAYLEQNSNSTTYTLHICGSGEMKNFDVGTGAGTNKAPWFTALSSATTSITAVTIDKDVTKIGNYALSKITSLTTINGNNTKETGTILFPAQLTSWGASLNGTGFSGVLCFPENCKMTDEGSIGIYGNNNITGVNWTNYPLNSVPAHWTEYGTIHTALTDLGLRSLPNTVTAVGNYAFKNSYATSVDIPNTSSVTYGFGTFIASQLTDVVINVKETGSKLAEQMFAQSSNLTSVAFVGNGLSEISGGAFHDTKLAYLAVPYGVSTIKSNSGQAATHYGTFGLGGSNTAGDTEVAFIFPSTLTSITSENGLDELFGNRSSSNVKILAPATFDWGDINGGLKNFSSKKIGSDLENLYRYTLATKAALGDTVNVFQVTNSAGEAVSLPAAFGTVSYKIENQNVLNEELKAISAGMTKVEVFITKPDTDTKTKIAETTIIVPGLSVTPKNEQVTLGKVMTADDLTVSLYGEDSSTEITNYEFSPKTALTTLGPVTITVTYQDKTATCTVTVVAAPVIPVTPSAPAQLPFNLDAGKTRFVDVSDNAWYASAVNYAVDKGLMNGTGDNQFSPEADTTRGMIVTILARLDGKNTSGTPWYQAGQRWAMEYEISDGTNMTGAITREQLVTMLFRYAVKNGLEAVTLSENLTQFTDASDISAWAVSAMQWAVGQGLIQGSNGQLRPQANASRAEVATILMRFCELLNK